MHVKKISLTLVSVLILYIIYYDLTSGTLPLMNNYFKNEITKTMAKENEEIKKITKTYFEVKVQPGDTVLSIIEKNHPKKTVEMTKIIQDFKKLNPKVNPEKIQIGKTYKFPIYK